MLTLVQEDYKRVVPVLYRDYNGQMIKKRIIALMFNIPHNRLYYLLDMMEANGNFETTRTSLIIPQVESESSPSVVSSSGSSSRP